jgi:hypothetical protein
MSTDETTDSNAHQIFAISLVAEYFPHQENDMLSYSILYVLHKVSKTP